MGREKYKQSGAGLSPCLFIPVAQPLDSANKDLVINSVISLSPELEA